MKEELKKLIEKVSKDTELKNKLKNAKDVNEILSITKEAGFSFTEDDFKSIQEKFDKGKELSSIELEKIAGGVSCGCVALGQGSGSDGSDSCVCEFCGIGLSFFDLMNGEKGQAVWDGHNWKTF